MKIRQLTNYMPDWLLFHWMTYRQNQAVDKALQLLSQKDETTRDNKPFDHSKPGINLIGFVSAGFGLGEAARSTIRGAKTVGIPLNVVDIDFNGKILSDRSESGNCFNLSRPITLFHFNPDMTRLLLVEPIKSIWLNSSYKIGYWMWETTELPQHWIKAAALFDEIWTASTFCQSTIASKIDKPVYVVPHNVDCSSRGTILNRKQWGIPEDGFVFLCAMDFRSRVDRKNPWAAIRSFEKTISDSAADAYLIIKVINSSNSSGFRKLSRICRSNNRIIVLDKLLPRHEMESLIEVSDALLSMHRAEGFGLPIAEAMSLGKPVIATGWSGNMDFMTEGNSFPVRYSMIKLKKNAPPYPKGTVWAEPDIDHAAEIMARLVKNAEMGLNKGKRARQDIAEGLSARKTGRVVAGRLEEIGNGLEM